MIRKILASLILLSAFCWADTIPLPIDSASTSSLETAVNDEFLPKALEAIQTGDRTGHVGDGKIFVLDLSEVLRIRTGETGPEAIG